jgi:urea transport system ATP-binding protein
MLNINNINVYYDESHILRNIDLHVDRGEMVCLIGRNGVGKTTLMKTILGLLKPRTGTIQIADIDITNKRPDGRAKLGIGYVPQGREIIGGLTVLENLILGLEALPKRPKKVEIPERIFTLFPVLKTMLNRQGGDLSGGQQQQLAIARALMGEPRLLILDEPTEGIQPSIVLEIEDAVRWIVENTGVGVLLVEQHLHFVRKADRYYAMQKGGIVASGNTTELSQETIDRFLAV